MSTKSPCKPARLTATGPARVPAKQSPTKARSPHDCLIVVTAVEHGETLLHGDRDFALLGRVEKRLAQWLQQG